MKRVSFFFAAIFCTALLGASAQAQSVVVNKYFNSGGASGAGDVVELLVVQNGLDMRGMILKDFSSSMANDGGGKYQFSTDALWSSVPAGTLIVLRNDTSATDTGVGSGDYNLDLGLKNTTYFAAVGTGTFDIATVELVMIKTAGSGDAGVTGSIHVLAGGAAGTQFTNAPTPKLRATGSSGTNQFVFANNSTQTLADFNGTDATGAATGLTFGAGNNANNTAFINSLRNTPTGEPTVQASNVTFTNVGSTSLKVNWTNGNGVSRIVLAKAGTPVDGSPVDGTAYAANAAFGSGAQIGAGNYVVFAGSANNVTVTNLAPNTTYFFAVFEFNGTGATADYLLANPATSSQTTAAVFNVSGRVQQAGGAGVSGATITLTGGASPVQTTTDAAGNYTFTGVTAGGNYTVTASATGFNITPASRTLNNLSGDQTADFTATPQVIISEFRFHGTDPDGAGAQTAATNEFVELYNQTDAQANISGWAIVTSDNTTTAKFVAPAGSFIPARGHFLVTGASYGLAAAAAADGSLNADIPDGAGVALFNNGASFTAGAQLDAVGFSAVASTLYRAGAGLTPASGITTDGEHSFARKLNSGVAQTTGDNAADFVFIATNGGSYDGQQATLGAPSPEGRNSPVQRNAQIKTMLIDPQAASTAAPNRVRDTTPDSCGGPNCSLGTLTIRRAFKNSTGAPVTQLRFRIVDITTLGSAGAGGAQADLRALTSANVTVTLTNGTSVPVSGLTLDTPPAQTLGGGLHSTLSAGSITTASPLGIGATINVQFVLGVQQGGGYRFIVNVEAPAPAAPASNSEHLVMGNPSNAVTDVNMPLNYLLDKLQYAVSYNRDRGTPNWVSWHLDTSWTSGTGSRQDDFRADPSLPADWYHVLETDYQGSGFDRGHHCPSADRLRTNEDNSATFFMTNMMPQAPDNNQGPWEVLESYSRTLVNSGNELYIVAGGVGQGGTGSNGGVTQTLANGHVVVPSQTWKVIIVLPVGTDDVSRVTTSTRTIAVIMPNTQGIRNNDWHQYIVSVDQVEALTGYDFFSNVPADIQAVIEARVDNQFAAPATAHKTATGKLR